ncbi:hypothetical protein TeGR_g3623 [Tetraparma gracilis]|uniref:5'-nucleotidase n=1 Tax=Tetraparma gracilis TaxID=2962635 RepID=A0ABQ6N1N1_9STRA|nr:hypothetical protein TeGR_g3623 [Tetraparma gracilis]
MASAATRATALLTSLRRTPDLHVLDSAQLETKLTSLLQGGGGDLSVTADFDRTLTSAGSVSSHGVVEHVEGVFDDSFQKQALATSQHYHAIEIDPKLSIEEKIPHMREWYMTNHALIVKQGITRAQIGEAVKSPKLTFREGALELLAKLGDRSVPTCIFSAGLGDVITEILRHRSIVDPSIRVVSNKMFFDESDNILVGFDNDHLIHMFNKKQSALSADERAFFDRPNMILMGDSIGDRTMCDGVSEDTTIIKVGFLNDHVEEKLELYKGAFDMVLVNDASMAAVLEIVEEALKQASPES